MTVRLLITKNEFEVLREAGASLRAPLSLPENMNLLPETVQQLRALNPCCLFFHVQLSQHHSNLASVSAI
jgi:hypothetical protein